MLDERLRVIPDKMQRLLEHVGWSPGDFAGALDIEMTEAYKLLSGEPVNLYTGKKFISYFSAQYAKVLLDWDAMAVKPPKFKFKSASDGVSENILFSMISQHIKDREKEKRFQ